MFLHWCAARSVEEQRGYMSVRSKRNRSYSIVTRRMQSRRRVNAQKQCLWQSVHLHRRRPKPLSTSGNASVHSFSNFRQEIWYHVSCVALDNELTYSTMPTSEFESTKSLVVTCCLHDDALQSDTREFICPVKGTEMSAKWLETRTYACDDGSRKYHENCKSRGVMSIVLDCAETTLSFRENEPRRIKCLKLTADANQNQIAFVAFPVKSQITNLVVIRFDMFFSTCMSARSFLMIWLSRPQWQLRGHVFWLWVGCAYFITEINAILELHNCYEARGGGGTVCSLPVK